MSSKKKNVLNIEKEVLPVEPITIKNTIVFTFEPDDEDGVNLMGTGCGDTWYLLNFKTDGTVRKYSSIPGELGFNLDGFGNLIIEEEE